MTAAIAAGLLVLAVLDGAFSGFRSSVGRTGFIFHRDADHRAARRGAGLVCLLLTPVIALSSADVVLHHNRIGAYLRAGTAMLCVYAAFGLTVLAALACYSVLGWPQRYLASAVVLGPLTLLRPGVALLGAVLGAAAGGDLVVTACAIASFMAVLAVEPIAGRLWYDRPGGQPDQP